jgi:hypothetical protein
MEARQQKQGNGKDPDHGDFMVVSRTDDGYRVYAAWQPERQYFVSGNLNNPACTCDAFAEDAPNGGTCEHYRAVCEQYGEDDPVAREERLAIQSEGQPTPKKKRKATNSNHPSATMTLKRSVSPDGRIDSLSVELSCPVEHISAGEIRTRATDMLKLQSDIASGFLKRNGNGDAKSNGQRAPANSDANAVPAKMMSIGAARNGTYFISFQANGERPKLFGTARQLAQAIVGAGYQFAADDVADGTYLNLPCRVTTKLSQDGRYLNVDRVLPKNGSTQRRRVRS